MILVLSLIATVTIVTLAFFPIRASWFFSRQYDTDDDPPPRRRRNQPYLGELYEVYDDPEL